MPEKYKDEEETILEFVSEEELFKVFSKYNEIEKIIDEFDGSGASLVESFNKIQEIIEQE